MESTITGVNALKYSGHSAVLQWAVACIYRGRGAGYASGRDLVATKSANCCRVRVAGYAPWAGTSATAATLGWRCFQRLWMAPRAQLSVLTLCPASWRVVWRRWEFLYFKLQK